RAATRATGIRGAGRWCHGPAATADTFDPSPRATKVGAGPLSRSARICPDCGAADSVLFLFSSKSFRPKASPTQRNMANGVEFRIMPSDDEGHWYWEVIKDGHEVVARGVADTEPAACEQADEAARKAKLIA